MKLIKVSAACEQLSVDRRTLMRMVRVGQLKLVRLAKKSYRVSQDEIEKAVKARTL